MLDRHIFPTNDWITHELNMGCACGPRVTVAIVGGVYCYAILHIPLMSKTAWEVSHEEAFAECDLPEDRL